MKKIITIAVIAMSIMSCGNEKEVTDNTNTQVTTNNDNIDGLINGTIKDMSAKDGCGFVIEVDVNGTLTQLEPLSLDPKYKVDGKQVQLIYTPSRRQSKCIGTMPITIDKIK